MLIVLYSSKGSYRKAAWDSQLLLSEAYALILHSQRIIFAGKTVQSQVTNIVDPCMTEIKKKEMFLVG